MSHITLSVVEPGSTPVDPVVPNTGLFTHGIGGPEATIITVSIVAIIAIVAAVLLYYKKKHSKDNTANKVDKAEKATKLAKTINTIKAKKKVSIPLAALALVVSLGTLTALLVNAGKSNTSAVEGDNSLTVTESSADLTIEVADEPVFAVLPVELTVEEATEAGYTLTAYTDNTDLVSTTDGSKIIPMVAADEGELVALADNTYGLSLSQPTSQDDEVYTVLSTDADNPTFITDKDYEGTGENDKTTIYYGFYITSDTPKGTYEGSEINYEAEANEVPATVVFDGNGLYFNNDEGQTTNTAKYAEGTSDNTEKYSHTPNVDDEGNAGRLQYNTITNDVVTIVGASKLHAVIKFGTYDDYWDYLSFWQGSHPEYTALDNYSAGIKECGDISSDGRFAGNYNNPVTMECDISGDSVTFGFWSQPAGGPPLGYGYYAIVTGYDADGNIIYLPENNLVNGNYLIPSSEAYSRFLGWSKTQEATVPEYVTEEDIKKELALTPGETTTLYAKWEPAFTISYNGNGADSTTNMDNVEQYTADLTSTEKQVDLLASNFTKSGYGFVGWSTDQDAWTHLTDDDESNNPIIYGPNQMITVDPSASTKLNLYAVWVPAEQNNGTPVSLQDWQGCSSLTPTTYSAETGTLTVGKNTITALTDARDGNIYTVARLADGNCWMTENLRLDNEPELSQQNTNNPSLPLTNNYAEQTTSNFLSATSNDWCTDYDSVPCYNQSKLNTNNTALTTTSPAFSQDFTNNPHDWNTGSLEANISSYSNYYNWYSATAGNGTYSKESGEVAGDICPAGWILPIGKQTSANGSFSLLDVSMGGTGSSRWTTEASNKWRSLPNNFVYSGDWVGSSANYRGNSGSYWASTAYDTDVAYYLSLSSGGVSPGTNSNVKYYGKSVRCVAPVGTTITFDGNGSTGGEMSKQYIAPNTTIPLNSNRFTKDTYIFVGWNTERDGSGIDYADGQNYTAGEGSNVVVLYAQWRDAVIGNLTYMQDFASLGEAGKASVLNSMTEGDQYQLRDSRDQKYYYISKLADGNIWMTQNLDLDLNKQTALTSENTNISANWTPINSTISFTGASVSGWSSNNNVPYSADPGTLYIYSSGTTDNDEQYTSLEACQAAHSDCNAHNHAGNYYNWSAAVANNDTSGYTTPYDNMTTSICPAGWRLPKNANADSNIDGNEQITMINSYDDILGEYSPDGPPGGYYNYLEGGFNKIRTAPLWLTRSGYVYGGSLYYTGSNGNYWSSTVRGSGSAYQLGFNSGAVSPADGGSRLCGYSIRCVAE